MLFKMDGVAENKNSRVVTLISIQNVHDFRFFFLYTKIDDRPNDIDVCVTSESDFDAHCSHSLHFSLSSRARTVRSMQKRIQSTFGAILWEFKIKILFI